MGNVNKKSGRFAPPTGKGGKTKTPPPIKKSTPTRTQNLSKANMQSERTSRTNLQTKQKKTLLSAGSSDSNAKTVLGG